jgi:hypothetical protein
MAPKQEKFYQINTKCTEGPPKFTKIGIFGFEINHLAAPTYVHTARIERAGKEKKMAELQMPETLEELATENRRRFWSREVFFP